MILKELLALNELTVNLALLDSAGAIVGVNSAWKRFADASGLRLPDYGLGRTYVDYCAGIAEARSLREEIRRLLAGEAHVVTFTYPCHSPSQMRWFVMIGLSLSRRERAGAVLMHMDLTDLSPLVFPASDLPAVRSKEGTTPEVALDSIAQVVQHAIVVAMGQSGAETRHKDPPVVGRGASAGGTAAASAAALMRLTVRQREVFRLLGEGKSNQDIARAMGLSLNTVKIYVSGILRQLALKSRTQVALLASRMSEE
jgi:DNA-binding CsgD family transcriptional regulator